MPTAGLTVGQLVTGVGIPQNTTLVAISADGTTLTLSAAATISSPSPKSPTGASLARVPTNLSFSNIKQIATNPFPSGTASGSLVLNAPGVNGTNGSLKINVSDLSDPLSSTTLDESQMLGYQILQFVTYDDVLSAFQQTAAYLRAYASFHDTAGQSPLTYALPTVNEDVTQLVDYAGIFSQFVDDLGGLVVDTTQGFQQQAVPLLARYGIVATFTPKLIGGATPNSGSAYYAVDVGVSFTGTPQQLRFDLENVPALVKLGGGNANLAGVDQFVDDEIAPTSYVMTEATATLNLTVGLNLANRSTPVPVLFDGSDLVTVSVIANGPDLSFPVSFGQIGLFVRGGTSYLNGAGQPGSTTPATFTIGLSGDSGGVNPFDGNLYEDSSVNVAGTAGVSLPISLTPTTPPALPPVTITINSLGGLIDSASGSVGPVQAPSLTQYDSLIEMIQNTPDLTSGLNRYLVELQTLMNSQVFNNSFPVVGNQIVSGVQFLDAFRVKLVNQVLNDSQGTNPPALIQLTLAALFGPGTSEDPGLGWLVDAQSNRATTQAEARSRRDRLDPVGTRPRDHAAGRRLRELEHAPEPAVNLDRHALAVRRRPGGTGNELHLDGRWATGREPRHRS